MELGITKSRHNLGPGGRWYLSGNFVAGFPAIAADNWKGVDQPYADRTATQSTDPFRFSPVATHTAEVAYALVLERAGATLPRRDDHGARIVEEVCAAIARFGETYDGGGWGIIDSQHSVGGWPELRAAAPDADVDHDGMPDAWEEKYDSLIR